MWTQRLELWTPLFHSRRTYLNSLVDAKANLVVFKVMIKFRGVEKAFRYKPAFGVNAISRESGIYRVGDKVRVISCLDRETLPMSDHC